MKKEAKLKFIKYYDEVSDIFIEPLKFENFRRLSVKKFFFFYSIFSYSVTTTLRVYIRVYFLF